MRLPKILVLIICHARAEGPRVEVAEHDAGLLAAARRGFRAVRRRVGRVGVRGDCELGAATATGIMATAIGYY